VPPTMNCDEPDLEAGCDLDYVPNKAYKYESEEDKPLAILSDNLGFGKFTFFYVIFFIIFMFELIKKIPEKILCI
jgi:3-oxoacyl-(acyl-carrier-protein) synthase